MKKRIGMAVVLLGACLLVGCGTVNTRVITTPPGASVYKNGRFVGTTPMTLPLHDGFGWDSYNILVEKEGFKSQSIELREHAGEHPDSWLPPTLEFNLTAEGAAHK